MDYDENISILVYKNSWKNTNLSSSLPNKGANLNLTLKSKREIIMEFLAVALITILAVISPGADFAMVTKNSYLYGKPIGILTAVGICLGVLVHVAYTLIAITTLMQYTPIILTLIKYLGAAYLIYLGYRTFKDNHFIANSEIRPQSINRIQALKYGFFTNALNPKTTLFVISTYTQIVSASTPILVLIGYGFFMSLAHLIWFVIVALMFSHPALRSKMLRHQYKINQMIGGVFIVLGGILLFSNIHV